MKAQDLKNSILQLAIQGRLVAQDANDEPAEVLYAKIQAEKQKLIKEGKIKKDKPLPPITDDEIPFEIPSTWKWVRLGDSLDVRDGTHDTPKYVDAGIPLVTSKNLYNGVLDLSNVKYISHKDAEKINERSKVDKNDILFAMIGTIGNPVIVDTVPNFCIKNMALIKNNEFIDVNYIALFLNYVQSDMKQKAQGAVQAFVSLSFVRNFLIPLPPLAEQKRIVAKIEELEPLVKQYDKAETELSALNGSFPEQLKKSSLQYAIQGKLVPQDANDESAEALYAKIQAEKQRLIKEGKIKKDKPLPPITDDEIPFAIPSTWKWVRLGDIIFKLTDGTHSTPKYTNQGVPFISVKDLSSGYINFSNTKFISEEEHKILSARCNPEKGDLLLTKVGTTGIPVIVDTDREFSLFVSVALVKLSKSNINLDFLKLLILSPLVQEQVAENTKGVGNKNWVIKDIANTFFPLPPLAEQKRIVSKVNDLMQYCEELGHPEKRKNVEPITIGWLIDKGFASCQQNGYTDVNAILDELGIAVMQDRNLKKGRIEYNNDKFQIWVNDLNDNWTKTHELVHYVNDNNEIKLYGAVGRKDETSLSKSKERNVDVLTAEILMPEDIFVSAVEQDNIGKYAFVDNATIRKLGKQFRVSDDAVKIRLQNLGYHTK